MLWLDYCSEALRQCGLGRPGRGCRPNAPGATAGSLFHEGGRADRLALGPPFGRDYAGLWIGLKCHFLAVLDASAFPSTVIGFKLGNLRIA